MASALETSTEDLTAARADVERVHDALTTAVGDVTATVTSLVGSGWRGRAATAFGEGFDEWWHGAARLLAALADSAEALAASGRAYTASDDAVTDTFAALGARLGAA